jgi:hypothetical protein
MDTQVQIHLACAVIDNFIAKHDPLDTQDFVDDANIANACIAGPPQDDHLNFGIPTKEKERAEAWREGIANAMWADYTAECICREHPEDIIDTII